MGGIDGVRRRWDDTSFAQRFTPRTARSIWNLVNIGHVERLTAAKKMKPAGLLAFAARDSARTGNYSFEQALKTLQTTFVKTFRANRVAWKFWQAQPPGHRKISIHWVMSAKRDATRERRFAELLRVSTIGLRLGAVEKQSGK